MKYSLKQSLALAVSLAVSAQAQGPVTLYDLAAAEGDFLTQGGQLATSVGTNGVIVITGKGVHDSFVDHGAFDAVWKESSNGVVFSATGSNYHELMSCSVDRAATKAVCSFSNQVGTSTFTGTFAPTAIPVLATVTPGVNPPSASASTSASASASRSASSSPSVTGNSSASATTPVLPTQTPASSSNPASIPPVSTPTDGSNTTTNATDGTPQATQPGAAVKVFEGKLGGIFGLIGVVVGLMMF